MSAIRLYVKAGNFGDRIVVASFRADEPPAELLDRLELVVARLLTLPVRTELTKKGLNIVRIDVGNRVESAVGNDSIQPGKRFMDLFLGDIPIAQVVLEYADMQRDLRKLVLGKPFVVRLLKALPNQARVTFKSDGQTFGLSLVGEAFGRASSPIMTSVPNVPGGTALATVLRTLVDGSHELPRFLWIIVWYRSVQDKPSQVTFGFR